MRRCEDDATGPCFCNTCPDWKVQNCSDCGRPYGEHVDELRVADVAARARAKAARAMEGD